MIILIAQFLLFYILSKFDFAIDFFSGFFEWKKSLHVFLFSKFRFSVGDLIYIILIMTIIYFLINLLITKKSRFLKYILVSANIFYFIYQCFWGMLYFQTPIIEKLDEKKITDSEIKALTIKYLNLCKTQREKLKEDKNGIFTVKNEDQLKTDILEQQKKLPILISQKASVSVSCIKPSLFDAFMNKTGILGYYNPFTSEAQYNPNIPSTQLPFTIAHELSHQLGYAREQEASFIAYLCGRDSQNPDLRYSAHLYALKSLIRAVSKSDIRFANNIISSFSEKMKNDRAYELKFNLSNEGLISDFFGASNDLFLKSNQQEGKISYSYFVNLLIIYEIQKKEPYYKYDSKNTNDEKKFIAPE
ncbi:DUF3810 domain-containing protein [Epilithonimonas mollis]|uniref:DUF3810 domain-containing protein n=1 Tax=Epilithonimonas mollis TaxID=216903 RepID=A0A1M6PCS3_9FLAO|nr:DUF3810 domain-containing protein [Epilithonimonas mollis]SHK05670.1 Protein of unknown function [Epilithonimonas mollis]